MLESLLAVAGLAAGRPLRGSTTAVATVGLLLQTVLAISLILRRGRDR